MVRQTVAPFEYQDDKGEIQTDEIVVRYFVRTAQEARDQHEAARLTLTQAKKNDEIPPFEYYMDTLSKRLESLPDLCDEQGKPFEITPENLGKLATVNLEAINQAIQEHTVPKGQSQQSPTGTNAATNLKAVD